MSNKRFIYLVLSFAIITGCYTTDISQVSYNKKNSKYINNLAILCSAEIPGMSVNLRTDEQFFSSLASGPAIVPQLLMQTAFHFARKDDRRIFNDMIFDLNIGEILCKKLNTKLQLCSYLHVVPQESVTKNKVVWELLEKKDKDHKDYKKIGTELGVDTLLEINILSYSLKDPGIFWDPYAAIKADVKMTTASEGAVLWRDVVEVKSEVGKETPDFADVIYDDAQLLKVELEKAADVVSEKCVEKLGFDTYYTYLLDRDYIERTESKMDIAEKLDELNNLRFDSLITNKDYDEKKINLIERAKSIKTIHQENAYTSSKDSGNKQVIMIKENNKMPLLPLPEEN